MRNVSGILRKRSLFFIPMALSVAAIVMLTISGIIDIDHVSDGSKQVGYLLAPNWTISPMVIFPLVGVLTLLIVTRVDRAIRELADRRMLYDTAQRQFLSGPAAITKRWNQLLSMAFWIWLVLTLLGVCASAKSEEARRVLRGDEASRQQSGQG